MVNTKMWNIRKATIDDANNLKICMDLAYSKYLTRLNGKRLPPMVIDYKEEIASFPVWVAETENKVVGGLILMFEDEYTTIANLAVHPDFQGKGLGRGLMDFAELEAKGRGYIEIRLATHVLLTENIYFYQNLGWVEVGGDDIRVYMKKHIRS